MNPYEVSKDPVWHRWIDGLVMLAIGLFMGLVISQAINVDQWTTTEVIKTVPLQSAPQIESGVNTTVPSAPKVEEG